MDSFNVMFRQQSAYFVRCEVLVCNQGIVKEATEIQLHAKNVNREAGFILSHTWQPVTSLLKCSPQPGINKCNDILTLPINQRVAFQPTTRHTEIYKAQSWTPSHKFWCYQTTSTP